MASISEQKQFYNDYWRNLSPLSNYKLERARWIMSQLQQFRRDKNGSYLKLLDLGCGDGRLLPLWQAITGAEAVGLELSPQAVQVASKMFPFLRYQEGDATSTDFPDAEFDIIVCQEVLEHVENQERLLAECCRILRPGGTLLLTTPNKFYFDRRKGGNYSNQPIENIIDKHRLNTLAAPHFITRKSTSLVYAPGDSGVYRLLCHKYWIAVLRRLRIDQTWRRLLLRHMLGVHLVAVYERRR